MSHNQTFSKALDNLKMNARVARAGWEGRYLILARHSRSEYPHADLELNGFRCESAIVLVEHVANSRYRYRPGWVPTQEDMLTDDWYVVPES